MKEALQVLCDVHHTAMEMISYRFSVPPYDEWTSSFMHCPFCNRHFSPLQGYVDLVPKTGIDSSKRRIEHCPNERIEWHGSKAIVGIKNGEFVWQCLHRECLKRDE